MKRLIGWILLSCAALVLDVTLLLPAGHGCSLFLAVCLATTAAWRVQDALPLALFGGLLIDAFCNSYAGLTAAGYLLSVTVFSLLIRKNAPKPIGLVLYGALATLAAFGLELIFSLILGAKVSSWALLPLRALLFCGLTALLALPFNRLLARWKRGQRDRI